MSTRMRMRDVREGVLHALAAGPMLTWDLAEAVGCDQDRLNSALYQMRKAKLIASDRVRVVKDVAYQDGRTIQIPCRVGRHRLLVSAA